jgi:hypothetical protein
MKTEGRPIGSSCGNRNDRTLLMISFILVCRLSLLDGTLEVVDNLLVVNILQTINSSSQESDNIVQTLPFLLKVVDDLLCVVSIVHNIYDIQKT